MADHVCAVSVTSGTDNVTARLDGEFDIAAVQGVSTALEPHLHRHVTVDMHAVEFLDSSGIHCLVRLRDEATRRGGHLTLQTISPPVRRVLDIVGLTGQLAVDP